MKKPCFVIIEVQRGEMVSCLVKDAKGQTLLSGQEASRAVEAVGKLDWEFDEPAEQNFPGGWPGPYAGQRFPGNQPEMPRWSGRGDTGALRTPPGVPVPQQPAHPAPYLLIPRRLLELNPASISGWPRRHWQVYLLVDGARCVGQIAAMLSQPPPLVEQVLREIQATGAITL